MASNHQTYKTDKNQLLITQESLLKKLTLRSGMLNLWLTERLLVRVVAAIILSHVCWQVFSPGAEINQNSVIVTARLGPQRSERGSEMSRFIFYGHLTIIQTKNCVYMPPLRYYIALECGHSTLYNMYGIFDRCFSQKT